MALTFRDTKGTPLTSAEADANIRDLAAADASEHPVTVMLNIGTASPSFGAVFATGGGLPGFNNNDAFLRANSVDGYFQFTMVGTGFSLWHAAYGGSLYKYDVWVNGVVIATVNVQQAANTPIYEIFRKDGLAPGVVHTVRLISVAAYGATLAIDQIRVRGTYTAAK